LIDDNVSRFQPLNTTIIARGPFPRQRSSTPGITRMR
jgi:hypothetical protein